MEIKPIAYIYSDFKEKFGIPRQSGRAKSLTGEIVFVPEYRTDDALRGIEEFSHLWIIFDFSAAHTDKFSPTVRPPRLGGNRRVGVFASRSPYRPNSIGLSSVKLQGVRKTSENGTVLLVSGIDMLDATPIYDIKPYIPYADCHADATGGFSDEFCGYRLSVFIPQELEARVPPEKAAALRECLGDDPRPAYQHDNKRIYKMTFCGFDVNFYVDSDKLYVTDIKKL